MPLLPKQTERRLPEYKPETCPYEVLAIATAERHHKILTSPTHLNFQTCRLYNYSRLRYLLAPLVYQKRLLYLDTKRMALK